jgi:GntR family transcriptional regulator/MocR family aminotransferase
MPRYQQIARQLKNAIEKGELARYQIASSRTWAQELGVSRSTVENAYAELVAQGWLARRGQAGTFVSEQLRPERAPASPAIFAGENPRPQPFQMGLPRSIFFRAKSGRG